MCKPFRAKLSDVIYVNPAVCSEIAVGDADTVEATESPSVEEDDADCERGDSAEESRKSSHSVMGEADVGVRDDVRLLPPELAAEEGPGMASST